MLKTKRKASYSNSNIMKKRRKSFSGTETTQNLQKAEEFVVEKIVDMKVYPQKERFFLVKWLGWGE